MKLHKVNPDDYKSRLTTAAKNIRLVLKESFPKTKFKVSSSRFSMGNSVDVRWIDGPTRKEVNLAVKRFQDHASDETGDFMDSRNDSFNDDFGGTKFVMTDRNFSKEFLMPFFEKAFGDDAEQAFSNYENGVRGAEDEFIEPWREAVQVAE